MALSSNSRLRAAPQGGEAPQSVPPPSVGADEISQLLDALNTADAKMRRNGAPVMSIPDEAEKNPGPKRTTGSLRLTGNVQTILPEPPPSPTTTQSPAATDSVIPELEPLVSFEEGTAKPQKGKEWVPGGKKKDKAKAPPQERTRTSEWTTGSVAYLVVAILLVAAYVLFYIVLPGMRDSSLSVPGAASVNFAKEAVIKTATETLGAAKNMASAASTAVADAVGDVKKKISTPSAAEKDEATAKTAPEAAEVEPAIVMPNSKYLPPWLRKDGETNGASREIVIKVPEVVDSPEVKEWPALKVSAVLAGGTRGGALVNGKVVSVGETTAEGPVLKSVSKQSAVFEWDGETRTFFVNAKPGK